MSKIDLSVVIPFYNEIDNLEKLHQELIEVLSKQPLLSEIVYVNDGSIDNSVEILKQATQKFKAKNIDTKLLSFRRNFGQTAASAAGIDQATGELVAFLDADLQNDPHDLVRFLEEIEKGYDGVFGWRKSRKDATTRSLASHLANFIIRKVFNIPLHDVGCALRVIKREILTDINLYGESHRLLPVIIYLKGAKIIEIVTNHRPRTFGKSKYGWSRVFKLIIDLITVKFLTSYYTKPAYVFGGLGFLSITVSFLTLVAVAYRKLVLGVFVHRDPLFLIAIFLMLVGINFILMGLLAELLMRTYFESQNKTIYEISSKENL